MNLKSILNILTMGFEFAIAVGMLRRRKSRKRRSPEDIPADASFEPRTSPATVDQPVDVDLTK